MGSIPWIQQIIAAGRTRDMSFTPGPWSKARFLFYSLADKIVDLFFWFVHGCPALLSNSRFTMKYLRQKCAGAGWPLTVISEGKEASTAPSSLKGAHLAVLLGEFSPLPEFAANAANGCIRACTCRPATNGKSRGDAFISIEHLAPNAGMPFRIFSQALPWQPFDGPLGFTLKVDLISDDLLLQTARSLLSSNPEDVSTEVSQWASKILAPSLSQLKGADKDTPTTKPGGKRCRSVWKLCLDTLLLLSPSVLGRNWYRRLSGRYPVLVLAHHLVSDRPHRMGVPTETYWKQVLFLHKHYRIVTLSEASELLRTAQIRVPTVVLTFDDGYGDNFLCLRAVASETGTPSTLFVTTGLVESHREFDHDLANGNRGFLPLTWDQITYWDTRGAEFGSHTRTHFDCDSIAVENLQLEIIGSRQDLEAHLKKPVNFFAFPYGKEKNMSPAAVRVAASTYLHYLSSFGGESLANGEKLQSHLFRKKFYGSPWELELELQSVFDLVDAIKQRFFSQAALPGNLDQVPVVSTLSPSIQTINAPSNSSAIYSSGQGPLKS
jgi:peptidoglycan/xylan/chitin deacetylase (PgdA/CDA1 family)